MKETPECCKNCVRWEKFGKQCWAYWELKKECTQHTISWDNVLLQ